MREPEASRRFTSLLRVENPCQARDVRSITSAGGRRQPSTRRRPCSKENRFNSRANRARWHYRLVLRSIISTLPVRLGRELKLSSGQDSSRANRNFEIGQVLHCKPKNPKFEIQKMTCWVSNFGFLGLQCRT